MDAEAVLSPSFRCPHRNDTRTPARPFAEVPHLVNTVTNSTRRAHGLQVCLPRLPPAFRGRHRGEASVPLRTVTNSGLPPIHPVGLTRRDTRHPTRPSSGCAMLVLGRAPPEWGSRPAASPKGTKETGSRARCPTPPGSRCGWCGAGPPGRGCSSSAHQTPPLPSA